MPTKPARRLEWMALDEIHEHPRNPKGHNLDAIEESVSRFGMVAPLILNDATGFLLAGHGRLATLRGLREKGAEAPPGVQVARDGTWRVQVVRGIALDEAEADRYLIADNRTTELGGWVTEELVPFLEDLDQDGGLGGTGFDGDALDDLRKQLEKASRASKRRTDPDDVPDVPTGRNVRVKPGDLWQLGDHRLLCGNSRDVEALRRVLPSGSAQLVVTSPPYNASIAYETHDDDMPVAQYLALVEDVAGAVAEVLDEGGFVAWNVGVTPKTRHFEHARLLEKAGLEYYREIVWETAGIAFPIWQYTNGPARKYHPNYKHELIYLFAKLPEAFYAPEVTHDLLMLFTKGRPVPYGEADLDDTYRNDVWHVHQSQATADLPGETSGRRPKKEGVHGGHKAAAHPAAFPVGIAAGPIKHLTSAGEWVLDPFGGSGTTLIACEQLGRHGALVELDPAYCQLAIDRWQNFTDAEAERVARA